jgi:hypothetical protein
MRDFRELGNYMTCVLLLTALSACALAQTVSPRSGFSVFSATSFTNQPDLTPYGLKRITVVHPDLTADVNNETSLAERGRLSTLAQLANESTGLLVIDIEEWPLVGNPATVAETVSKYRTVLQLFKTPAPALKVGLYSVLPIRDYWNSLQQKDSRNYIAWQKENDRLASIAQLADVLFPSIYTFYEDRIGWQKYAIAQTQEARRYAGGKPVYVFLWPHIMCPTKISPTSFYRAITGAWNSTLPGNMLMVSSSGAVRIGRPGMRRPHGGWKLLDL